MPRPATVSSEQLTDALMRLVVDGGLEAVSVRTVAKEAGVPVGAGQYHFATKDDLLIAAYSRVIDQVDPALDARSEAAQAVAMADGLAWHVQCAPALLSPEAALAALDAQTARLAR